MFGQYKYPRVSTKDLSTATKLNLSLETKIVSSNPDRATKMDLSKVGAVRLGCVEREPPGSYQ